MALSMSRDPCDTPDARARMTRGCPCRATSARSGGRVYRVHVGGRAPSAVVDRPVRARSVGRSSRRSTAVRRARVGVTVRARSVVRARIDDSTTR